MTCAKYSVPVMVGSAGFGLTSQEGFWNSGNRCFPSCTMMSVGSVAIVFTSSRTQAQTVERRIAFVTFTRTPAPVCGP